jgi:shikimate dehydrogenase
MHMAALRACGLPHTYGRIHILPEELAEAIALLPQTGFTGVNLTIPLKELALDIVDRIDPLAQRIGAINCVVVGADGALEGYNYDAFGFIESLREQAPDWRADSGPCVLLGAGGASRAIIAGLLGEGATEIRLANRTLERAQSLAAEFGSKVKPLDWREREAALGGASLLVNCTSMGMVGQPSLEIALDDLPTGALVSDIVYVPLETQLLANARARGNAAVGDGDVFADRRRTAAIKHQGTANQGIPLRIHLRSPWACSPL